MLLSDPQAASATWRTDTGCPLPMGVCAHRPVMWCQRGQQPELSCSVMVPTEQQVSEDELSLDRAGGQP